MKGRGFESLQERRDNFLLQGRPSVLTLISVSVPPPCYRSSGERRKKHVVIFHRFSELTVHSSSPKKDTLISISSKIINNRHLKYVSGCSDDVILTRKSSQVLF